MEQDKDTDHEDHDHEDRPARLYSAATEFEATIIANALNARGIEASTTGGFIAGFRAEAPSDVDVFVRQSQLDKARKLLETIRNESK